MNLVQFQKEAHQLAKEKGLWVKGKKCNRTEQVMLILTKLSKAVEAYLKGKTFIKSLDFLGEDLIPTLNTGFTEIQSEINGWVDLYNNSVKNTMEAEMAGAAIRLLDYFGGWDIAIDETLPNNRVFKGNFSEDVFYLVGHISTARTREIHQEPNHIISMAWSSVVSHFIDLCQHYKIEIFNHVKWKLTYTSIFLLMGQTVQNT